MTKTIFIILVFLMYVFYSQSIIIQPGPEGKDTYIQQNTPTTNYGSSTLLSLQNQVNNIRRILIEFNLSAIPEGVNITSAVLSLYQYSSTGTTLEVGVYRLTRNWTEAGATWNTYDGVNPWTNPGGDYETIPVNVTNITTASGWKMFNITTLVDVWYRGLQPNYGLILAPTTSTTTSNLKNFYSSDYGTASLRPMLTINYADLSPPNVILISPPNTSVWNTSNLVVFQYNVTDFSNISSCSLIINNTLYQTDFNIQKNIIQNFTQLLPNGNYTWSVNCTDTNGYTGSSITWNLLVNYTPPYVVTDSSLYKACNIIYYNISVFDVNDNPIDSTLNIFIIDSMNNTVESVSTTTGNGGVGVYLGNYTIGPLARTGKWIIKVIAGVVKEVKELFVN